MKKLTKNQENTYTAAVSQRGNVLDDRHDNMTPTKVGVAVLTITGDTCGVKHHVVGFNTKQPTTLNELFWSDALENVVLTPNVMGPNLDLSDGVSEGISTFNKLNAINDFTGRSYVLSDVLVF